MDQIQENSVLIDTVRAAAVLFQEGSEKSQVGPVRLDCFFRQPADDGQVLEVGIDVFMHAQSRYIWPLACTR